MDNACTWSLVSSEDGVTVHKCDTCGAERHSFAVEREPSYDGQIPHTETCIYYRNGEEIYRFEYGAMAQ